jgi:radical SAM superfamily enzyme YgiQ (UPF0313 family)
VEQKPNNTENRKKLILINPINAFTREVPFLAESLSPPLGLGIVAALTPSDWEVELIDETFEAFRFVDADLVGITALTSAVRRAYEIAAVYREKGIPVVLGGIHASMMPHEASKYVDVVVIGEAEGVWGDIIHDFTQGNLQKTYQKETARMFHSPKPRRDLFHQNYGLANIQTTRGCPFSCDFCSVHIFNGPAYRYRPVDEVLDELEEISHNRVFFVDDNIIGTSRFSIERAKQLFRGIIERGIQKDWVCQASMNFADDPEVLELASKSGCRTVLLGIESETTEGLQLTNKRLNIRIGTDHYAEVISRIHNFGISVIGAMIYGLDTDNTESLDARSEYLIRSEIDTHQANILTPLPGTELYKRLMSEGRITATNYPDDWDRYHCFDVVFEPKNMSADELKEAMIKNWEKVWDKKLIYRKFLQTIKLTGNKTAANWAFFGNIERYNLALGKIREPFHSGNLFFKQ